ncbi:hypothetical protein ASZ90_018726 [hydrocarbon metagenome]|uniref:Uncharacterized protein n=1 Tax=hydrocarbon metagenome TaxID=938273 RepID=A0A0W8E5I6_9ZZZZ
MGRILQYQEISMPFVSEKEPFFAAKLSGCQLQDQIQK